MKTVEERRSDAMSYYVQTPAQQAVNFEQLATDLANNEGLTFGNALDSILRPLVGGDLMMMLARTGHGKTTVGLAIARGLAYRIANGLFGDKDSIVIFATLEQSADYAELMLAGNNNFDSSMLIRGDVESDEYNKWTVKRPSIPLWMIGDSRRFAGHKREDLYFETIIESIEAIQYEYNKKPAMIFVDYLQQARMRDGSMNNKHVQVMEAAAALKRLAVRFDVPVIFGSQAAQRVDDYADKLPKLNDSMWASDASHLSDIVLGIMRPSRYWSPLDHPEVEINNRFYTNDDRALIVTVLKQRFHTGWGEKGLTFVPQTLELSDMVTVDLNKVYEDVPQQYEQIQFEELDL